MYFRAMAGSIEGPRWVLDPMRVVLSVPRVKKFTIQNVESFEMRGAHWVLMWHLTRSGLYHCLMPYYAQRCQTSTLIMVPINFWRNSDPFKRKQHFSSSKIDRVFDKSLKNFHSKSLKYGRKMFETVSYLSWVLLNIKHHNFKSIFKFCKFGT